MIVVENLCKSFGKLLVLDDVSFEVKKGGIFAVLGPNGSGKTTFLKILLGMVIPQSGLVTFDGKDISHAHEYRKHLGYLPQIARFPDNLTVSELITMITDIRQEPADPDRLIALFGIENFLDKKLGNLSGGTRQKVNLVLTFMFDSPVIILDEPTAGLDPVSMIRLKKLLFEEKEQGKVILITSHIMSLVEELADEVIFLLEGKIYFKGSLAELRTKTNTATLEESIATILEP
ncbi:MAG: Cu-processing system ATP-binding protein [Marinoscillum sp.]|jgi:Cu-processing system ATP-binding protein